MPRRASNADRSSRRGGLADELVRDFGRGSPMAGRAIGTLYAALNACLSDSVEEALASWSRAAACSGAAAGDRTAAVWSQLAACYGLAGEGLCPERLLFVLQTYYALVVRVLLAGFLSSLEGQPAWTAPSGPSRDSALRRLFERLEGRASAAGSAASDPPAAVLADLVDRLGGYGREIAHIEADGPRDLFKPLYQDLFPRRLRHALGEYYTPDWLAESLLDQVGYQGQPGRRLLDPACGSGTFLVAAVRRARAGLAARADLSPEAACGEILDNLVGLDLNPLAVLSARANYWMALGELARAAQGRTVPVYRRDSILAAGEEPGPAGRPFDDVVGNPPWIAWDDLPDAYRQATKPLWSRYGLFSLSAREARHGGGKKDLSMLMLYVAADRYLKDRGRLAMVVTQTLFQTRGAGDGFRRFRLGDEGPWLRLLRVDDLADVQPFPGAANWTATLLLEKGLPTVYPVPYVRWSATPGVRSESVGNALCGVPGTGDGPFCARANGAEGVPRNATEGVPRNATEGVPYRKASPSRSPVLSPRCYQAEPIDPDRPTSPLFLRPQGLSMPTAQLIGPSDYVAHLGANSGGANAVFWVEVIERCGACVKIRNMAAQGKRQVQAVETVVEPDLLYPLLRWGDVARYRAAPSAHLLLVQDPQTRRGIDQQTLAGRYPLTYEYLKRFQPLLASRAAYRRYQHGGPFYAMYDVGPYTLSAAKVVWRRMDRRTNAAVVETLDDPRLGPRPVIPQETCVLVACDSAAEAYYLCGLLNSALVTFLVTAHSVRGGKGFGSPAMLDVLRLPRFDPQKPCHQELAACCRQAHQTSGDPSSLALLQQRIDALAADLWGLTPADAEIVERELS
jgi:SAM-dependent methyltransferase